VNIQNIDRYFDHVAGLLDCTRRGLKECRREEVDGAFFHKVFVSCCISPLFYASSYSPWQQQ
jgi:hypothetical protein